MQRDSDTESTDTNIAVRVPLRLQPDPRRVHIQIFVPGQEDVAPSRDRTKQVVQRVMDLSDEEVRDALHEVRCDFGARHADIDGRLAFNAHVILSREGLEEKLPLDRRLLIGATFTREFSVEGVALCNPSMVPHPNQHGVQDGSCRFVMSVRGIGEGHKSSIGFRTGVVNEHGAIEVDRPMPHLLAGAIEPPLRPLPAGIPDLADERRYRLTYPGASDLSERLMWPHAPAEQQGMEDARFTTFSFPDGPDTYLATYTAFDGREVLQQALQTDDFINFEIFPLFGPASHGKGLAFFPRKVGSRYAALSRSDHESNFVAFSDSLDDWREQHLLVTPHKPWEIIQRGNCGSPIETEAGWLMLTHAVGVMRSYFISATLLDLEDPTRVIGELNTPLLSANAGERDGYVPNVVYSCGAMVHGGSLIIPYGIADNSIGIASVDIAELLSQLTN